MDTQPNSPVIPGVTVPMPQPPVIASGRSGSSSSVFEGLLPPGFVPQTITNSRGVTTPIPQLGEAPVSTPASGSLAGRQNHSVELSRQVLIYGNPLNQDRGRERNDGLPTMTSAYVSNRMGEAMGTPTRVPGNGPVMTPVMGTQDLSGSGLPPFRNYAPIPGMPTYAPPTMTSASAWRYPPGPLPPSAPSPEDDEDSANDCDLQTLHNTMINTTICRPVGYNSGVDAA